MDVNVHILLPESIIKLAVRLNRLINTITPSELDFGGPFGPFPHLTLTMGELRDGTQMDQVTGRVQVLASRLKSFSLLASRPHIASSQNYVFLDVDPKLTISHMKKAAFEDLEDLLDISWAGMPESEPHITIGFISCNQDMLTTLFSSDEFSASGVVERIGVSHMGVRGTCRQLLESYQMKF